MRYMQLIIDNLCTHYHKWSDYDRYNNHRITNNLDKHNNQYFHYDDHTGSSTPSKHRNNFLRR